MSVLPDIRRLLHTLAVCPVVPPAEALEKPDAGLRALLADLARAEDSSHAVLIHEVAADRAIAPEELARRAEFLLACLILPLSGTHYEVLGVAPDATTAEIRQRWARLIRDYHPDRFGGASGRFADRARRLNEAYQTLKDPAERHAYDAALPPAAHRVYAELAPSSTPRLMAVESRRWWLLGCLAVGLAAAAWLLAAMAPAPLPTALLPPSPQLLATWGRTPPALPPEPPREARSPLPDPRPTPAPVSTAPEITRPVLAAAEVLVLPVLRAEPAEPGAGLAREGTPTTAELPLPALAGPVVAPATVASSPSRPSVESPSRVEGPSEKAPVVLVEAFRSAYEQRDLGAVMWLFSSEPRERNVRGRAALEALYARNFALLDQIRYELAELSVRPVMEERGHVVEGRFRIRANRLEHPVRMLDVAGPIRWFVREEAGVLRIAEVDYEVPSR